MREYLLVLFVAAGVTYVMASLARRLAFRYNAVALVRVRDVHTKPVPYFGGVAMLAGVAAALIVATHLPWLGRYELVQRDAWVILAGCAVICIVGVVDDLFELGAAAKLSGEVLAAGIVVLNGVKFYWIPFSGPDHCPGQHCFDRARRLRHLVLHQRRQLDGRTRRACGGRGGHRCRLLLPLRLPAEL